MTRECPFPLRTETFLITGCACASPREEERANAVLWRCANPGLIGATLPACYYAKQGKDRLDP